MTAQRSDHRTATYVATLLALALGACVAPDEDLAEAEVVMSLSAAEVTSVTLTVTGDSISPAIVLPLSQQSGTWSGLVQKIPAGTDRTFVVEAFDASSTAIYRGQAANVTITKGSTIVVAITAQQIGPPPTSNNAAPIIDALVVSSLAIAPSETISIDVQAHDPNADAVSFAWSGAGTFSAATAATTSWVAPATEADYDLVIAASDPAGESAQMSFRVKVNASHGKGDASVDVTINTWPAIADLSATVDRLHAAGSATSLDVIASDADADALSYSWSADCAGTFDAATTRSPTFTLAALPAAGSCTFTARVEDGRGGVNTGTLSLPTGADPSANQAPQIVVASQSTASADPGQTVSLYVQATDPEGGAVSFAWSVTVGSLGVPTTTTSTSTISWTAPGPFSAPARIEVVVTDESGVATTQSFDVEPNMIAWNEEFSGPLGAEWGTFHYAFSGSRSHGYTSPANHSSIASDALRYQLEPMTHYNGFLNGFQRTNPNQWSYTYDPGHEVYRALEGDRWTIEAKVRYYLPPTNGRNFSLRIFFGDGAANGYASSTVVVETSRGRDVGSPPAWEGSTIYEVTGLDSLLNPVTNASVASSYTADAIDDYTMFIRFERSGGVITSSRSIDGVNWTTIAHDFGGALAGKSQRLAITGGSWFNSVGSFAEYDYIRFAQF